MGRAGASRRSLERALLAGWLVAAAVVAPGWIRAQAAGGVRLDPELFGAPRWRSIGPDRGGRSLAVVGSPSRPHAYYCAAMGGALNRLLEARGLEPVG